jgi:hypothetical protein
MSGDIRSYFEERTVRRRRKKFLLFFGVGYAALLILLWLGQWFFFKSPLWNVQHVEIQGEENVSQAQVLDLLHAKALGTPFFSHALGFSNMLAWKSELTETDASLLPSVKSIAISKNYFTRTISVVVTEREPVGVWCELPDGQASPTVCWWFDRDGLVFKKSLPLEGSVVKVVYDTSQQSLGLGTHVLPQQFLSPLFSVFEVLQTSGLAVQSIRLHTLSSEELEVQTANGPLLYFSLRFSAANTSAVLEKLMQEDSFKKLEYVDFRVENRAYYK